METAASLPAKTALTTVCGTRDDVAAGEDAGDVRGEGDRIDVEVFPFIDGDAALLRNEIEIRLLADGRNRGSRRGR